MATQRQHNRKAALGMLLALLALILIVALVGANIANDTNRQTEQTVKSSVEAAATQCFALEGAYPPDLGYLEAHYGLQYNTVKFIVSYDRYASDRPPVVEVLTRDR